jgi:hypothetical protein
MRKRHLPQTVKDAVALTNEKESLRFSPKDPIAFFKSKRSLSVLPKDPIAFLCIITPSFANVNPLCEKSRKNFGVDKCRAEDYNANNEQRRSFLRTFAKRTSFFIRGG